MVDYQVRKKRIEPLWDRVDRNRIELAILLLLFFAGTSAVLALLLVALVVLVYVLFVFVYAVFAEEFVRAEVGFGILGTVWGYFPHVIETPNVNAFVFQRGRRSAVVGVTRGLTARLTDDEQRAVFANLMARLKNGDMLWASAVTALMSL